MVTVAMTSSAHARMSMAGEVRRIKGFFQGLNVLVWTHEEVEILKTSWRIIGILIGAHPQQPHQNAILSLPLLLLPEEVMLLLELDVLELYGPIHSREEIKEKYGISIDQPPLVDSGNSEKNQQFATDDSPVTPLLRWTLDTASSSCQGQLKYRIFKDLWVQGYYLTSGLKFGGDFLVYKQHPDHAHASYIALVTSWQHPLNNRIGSMCRVSTQVGKQVLVCSAKEYSRELVYFTMDWTKLQ